ncbi:MAG TPA: YihY family inner membrane protein, partial [Burkholderiaceae bacterium]|nr:YihY family inner membrane protein [Burkholderiaceae bacterium]
MRLNIAPWLDRYPWLKRAHDVAVFARRRARDVKMAQVAGSLTFTTTLTIVPLFAVALALFTAFPLFVEFRGAVENFVLKALPGQISDTVLRYINEFALKATRLTALGLIFLAVTAVAMMVTVEHVLNDIWRVKNRRSLTRRVLMYWAILTLGPLLVGASLSASSYLWSLSSDAIAQLPRLIRGALDYVPVIISGFAYAALYVFVPNR